MLLGTLVNSQSQMPKSSLQALHSLRGSSASVDCASPLAPAFRPVGDETDLARLALRPLAAALSRIAPPGARATGTRHLQRSMLDRSRTLSHERRSRTRPSAAAGIVALSRIECAHLRDLRRQTRSLFLQPRRRQSTRSLGRSRLFSPALFSCCDDLGRAQRNDPLLVSPSRRVRRFSRPLSPHRSRAAARPWIAGTLADRTLLLVHGPRWGRSPRRNPSPAVASAKRRSRFGNQHGRRRCRNFATGNGAFPAFCPKAGSSDLAPAPRRFAEPPRIIRLLPQHSGELICLFQDEWRWSPVRRKALDAPAR